MATLIVQCRTCKKDVEAQLDLDLSSKEHRELVRQGLKHGTLCEMCGAEYSRNYNELDDCCYACHAPEGTQHSGGCPVRIPMPEVKVLKFIMDKYIETAQKALEPPTYIVDYDKSDPGNIKFMAGKPGAILKIKRYKLLALPGPLTEGEVPPPYPKLEFDEVAVCATCGTPEGSLHTKAACEKL